VTGMRTESRLLLVLSAILLVPVFWLPLWSIRIVAPQYREGLGMNIGLRDIWGQRPHDIQNINILNHYIGMKPIVPEEVGVLTIMPWAVAFLMVSAVVVAAVGRRWAVWGWLGTFLVLGTAGMAEFWRWNHDYGHNLSPDAPIKVPGMTYSPPIFGSKQLLNITTTSLPSWGTLFIALSVAAALAALYVGRRALRSTSGGLVAAAWRPALGTAAAAVVAALLAGCAGGAEARGAEEEAVPAFANGGVPCDFCEGTIPEVRFGGEVVTAAGETFRFMSVECLAGFLLGGRVPAEEIRSVRVVDYDNGERLVDAASAYFLRSQFLESPSGLRLLATDREKIARNLHYFFGGERLTWEQVLALVAAEWGDGREG
jgi:copper chaperone NosL